MAPGDPLFLQRGGSCRFRSSRSTDVPAAIVATLTTPCAAEAQLVGASTQDRRKHPIGKAMRSEYHRAWINTLRLETVLKMRVFVQPILMSGPSTRPEHWKEIHQPNRWTTQPGQRVNKAILEPYLSDADPETGLRTFVLEVLKPCAIPLPKNFDIDEPYTSVRLVVEFNNGWRLVSEVFRPRTKVPSRLQPTLDAVTGREVPLHWERKQGDAFVPLNSAAGLGKRDEKLEADSPPSKKRRRRSAVASTGKATKKTSSKEKAKEKGTANKSKSKSKVKRVVSVKTKGRAALAVPVPTTTLVTVSRRELGRRNWESSADLVDLGDFGAFEDFGGLDGALEVLLADDDYDDLSTVGPSSPGAYSLPSPEPPDSTWTDHFLDLSVF